MTDTGVTLYLELIKKVIANEIYTDNAAPWWTGAEGAAVPEGGLPGTSAAHTLVGLEGLDNVQECVERVLADGIPGDLVETGVWRGGVTILMRAILKAHGVTDRRVWAADSFEGVPEAGEGSHPLDQEMALHNLNSMLSVSADAVRANFKAYDLLDEQVEFLEGWFKDTLPAAPISSIAVLRLDGDLYESTREALIPLYPKLSAGGFIIIDDYNMEPCRAAVHEYRDEHGITDEIRPVDNGGVYWRKTA
ncbi:TylF/MycF/NovP-related O-methyltransferase [Micromonospora purpureochromogenes]|uniref:TylF/MycF/NovP-related O-methyltransferase n=1 Tax=Micromonospora purpureochromogenes TaxID=47872 RepID=UPI00363656ED